MLLVMQTYVIFLSYTQVHIHLLVTNASAVLIEKVV